MGLRTKFTLDDSAVAALAFRLNELSAKHAKKAIKKGIDAATKFVAADAKARVPRRTGLLKKSIGRRVQSYRGGTVVSGLVGPRRGFATVLPSGKKVNPAKYAHLVEFGRKVVVAKKALLLADRVEGVVFGKQVRAVAPRPFLRPAWDANKGRVTGEMVRQLNAALAEFARGRR